ncbi:MAG TPA: hypothetical protein PLR88_12440 [Bacteroidales bacterium]|nr:hypothetical protein [Bacteroidales bacterium]
MTAEIQTHMPDKRYSYGMPALKGLTMKFQGIRFLLTDTSSSYFFFAGLIIFTRTSVASVFFALSSSSKIRV